MSEYTLCGGWTSAESPQSSFQAFVLSLCPPGRKLEEALNFALLTGAPESRQCIFEVPFCSFCIFKIFNNYFLRFHVILREVRLGSNQILVLVMVPVSRRKSGDFQK